tara:strand:- start:1208 stop:1594 length:387 start_codon:yes stop_codon:yes gene_type:complete
MLGADGLDAARALRAQLADEAQQRWAAAAETAIVTLQRALAAEKVRGRAELDALRAELQLELIDREANSARVHERQKYLFERQEALSGQSTAFERAAASAAYLESALLALDVHVQHVSPGCELLAPSE